MEKCILPEPNAPQKPRFNSSESHTLFLPLPPQGQRARSTFVFCWEKIGEEMFIRFFFNNYVFSREWELLEPDIQRIIENSKERVVSVNIDIGINNSYNAEEYVRMLQRKYNSQGIRFFLNDRPIL